MRSHKLVYKSSCIRLIKHFRKSCMRKRALRLSWYATTGYTIAFDWCVLFLSVTYSPYRSSMSQRKSAKIQRCVFGLFAKSVVLPFAQRVQPVSYPCTPHSLWLYIRILQRHYIFPEWILWLLWWRLLLHTYPPRRLLFGRGASIWNELSGMAKVSSLSVCSYYQENDIPIMKYICESFGGHFNPLLPFEYMCIVPRFILTHKRVWKSFFSYRKYHDVWRAECKVRIYDSEYT